MKTKFFLLFLFALFGAALDVHAQMSWSSYNTSGTRVSASAATFNAATNVYSFTIPANTSYTLVTTNFAPVTLAASQTKTVTFTMTASGGFGPSGTPVFNQRFIAYGLFNYGATAPGASGSFTDDVGLWTDSYQQSTGIAAEVFGGTSAAANLLNYNGGNQLGAAIGPSSGAVGQFTDSSATNVTFRVVENGSGSASIGTDTTTALAGAWYQDAATSGTTFNRTIYSGGAATPTGTTTFNEFAFMFNNTTASSVTLTLGNIVGLTPPPIITTQPPATSSATTGSNLTISVVATGATSYQWQKSTDGGTTFTPISGNATATTASLTLSSVASTDAAVYNVIVTNAVGSTTSTSDTVTINAGPPSINVQPSGTTMPPGASASFSVTAGGIGLSYQWSKSTDGVNFTAISGATSATYSISSVALSDSGSSYRVTVTNSGGSVTSSAALLTVQATTVFNDTFANSSTINNTTLPPAAPLINKATYQQISAKTFNPNPPTIASGSLRFGSVSTSSGFSSIEALFSQYPVTLTNTNDYIEMTVVFTDELNLMNASNGTLMFGLDNSGQVQPIPGGMNGTSATATAGYAQNWQGYVSRILYSGSPHSIFTRPAQTAAAANNQDVLYNYGSGTNLGQTANSTVTAFTNGLQYAEVLRITKTGASALTILSTLYQGSGTGGTQLFSQTVTTSSILTPTFDALGIGYRAVGSVASIMQANSIKVVTTASTTVVPQITTQPSPTNQSIPVGTAVTYSVVAAGGGAALTYQWQKSTDNGSTYSNISGAAATSATYSIGSSAVADSGMYRLQVTDGAGTTVSNAVTLTVSTSNLPPQITAPPTPSSSIVVNGSSASFTVQVSGSPQPTVQWQKSTDGGANYSNVGTATQTSPNTYTISSVQLSDTGLYRVVATNSQGSATSSTASLTVQKGVTISTQPIGTTLSQGGSYTLSVAVNGDATPAPAYQWYKNGTAISGATGSSLALSTVTGANAGNYYVVVSNAVNSATSNTVYVGVNSATMTVAASVPFGPVNTATAINPDTLLTITLNQAVSVGVSGKIRVYDSTNSTTPVDTIDMSTAHVINTTTGSTVLASGSYMVKTIGGLTFNYMPVTVSGNTATIALHSSTALTYGKTYYVNIDPGVLLDSTGATFAGISDSTTWRFSTKASGPAASAAALTVAADGSGDFNTVQGAIDFVPFSPANTIPRTITVKNGTYTEYVHVRSGQNLVTLTGQTLNPALVAIQYLNNNFVLNDLAVHNSLGQRGVFFQEASDFTLENMTIHNLTPHLGSQAEAFVAGALPSVLRCTVYNTNILSYQDTILTNGGQVFFTNCYVEGDTDFMWGGGNTFFQNSELKMMTAGGFYTQVRNTTTQVGNVYVNCRLTPGPGVTGSVSYLSRIDPVTAPSNVLSWPNSNVVWINCQMGTHVIPVGWQLNNSTTAPNVRFWEYGTTDLNGTALDISGRATFSQGTTTVQRDGSTPITGAATVAAHQQVDSVTAAYYSNAANALGWSPIPVIGTQPAASQSVNAGQSVSFSVAASSPLVQTYQWYKNNVAISGATGASYPINSSLPSDTGSYKVVVTNAAGSVTSSAAALTVTDTTPPTVAAPAGGFTPLTLATGAGGTVALPDYTSQAVTSDNVGVTSVTQSPGAGSVRSVGTTHVTLTAFDAAGNSASTSFDVAVADGTPPAISGTFTPLTLTTGAGGTVALPSYVAQAVTSDNVGVTSVAQSPAAGSARSAGTTHVTLTASDAAGNSASTGFDVAVADGTPPVVAAHANVTVEAVNAFGATVNYAPGSATDNVGVTSLTYSQGSGTVFPLGTTTVTITASDAANNTGTGTFTVSVVDTTAPVVAAHANVTVEATSAAGAVVSYAAGSATDSVTLSPTITYSQDSGTVFPLGTTTVTITAKDAANNAGTGTFTVSVVDTTAPVVTPPANATVAATSSAGAVVTYSAASISDAVGFTSVTYSKASGSSFPIGATTVTVTAKDAANNTGTATFTVTVTASTPAQYWRYAHFGTLENTGDAADDADPDHDGIPNVLEFAFGTDPLSAASGPGFLQFAGTFADGGTMQALGQPIARFESIANGIDFRALFVRRTDFAAVGLTYVVEFSATLGTWQASIVTPTVLADDGTLQIVSVPYPVAVGGKKARFFRVRVTSAP